MATKTTKKPKAGKPEAKVKNVKAANAANQFIAEVNGEEKTFEITDPKFKLDGEVYTAEEAAQNPDVCAKLVKMGAGNIKEIFPTAKKPKKQEEEPAEEK